MGAPVQDATTSPSREIRKIRKGSEGPPPLLDPKQNYEATKNARLGFIATHLSSERRDRLEEGLGVRPAPCIAAAALVSDARGDTTGRGASGAGVILTVVVPAPPAGTPAPAGAAGTGRSAPTAGVPRHAWRSTGLVLWEDFELAVESYDSGAAAEP